MAKRKERQDRLSRAPQNVGVNDWYYEEPKGIQVIHEIYDAYDPTHYIRTDRVLIPWSMLRASVKRKDADMRRQRKARAK
jgi:hypothetical protein